MAGLLVRPFPSEIGMTKIENEIMEKLKRVVCIGECMLEFSEHTPGNYKLAFAGDTFNTAWYLRARLGADWQVDYITAIGDDAYSEQMLAFFDAHHIGTACVKHVGNRRPGLYIIHQSEGDRHFTYWRDRSAAKQLADDSQFLRNSLSGTELVYFSGITLAILDAPGRERLLEEVKRAKSQGAIVAFDPNERPALWESLTAMKEMIEKAGSIANFVFPTFPDAQMYFDDKNPEAVALRYLNLGASEVVIKNGAEAALVATIHQRHTIQARSGVTSIDPTGAGDSFNGAYLAARLQGSNSEDAAKSAHNVAGTVIGHRGALVPMEIVRPAI